MALLELHSLQAGYGAAPVLHDLSLHVDSGEMVGIVGANGAGKTSVVRAVAGLLAPQRGSIRLAGREVGDLPAHQRSSMGLGVVLENRHLFSDLSVRQNLRLAEVSSRRHKRPIRFESKELLAMFPIVSDKLDSVVRLLSGGQQQMVAIARALLLQPDVLVLDEPSTGLSPRAVNDVLEVLFNLRERGTGVLLVEQSLAIAAKATDRAYVMSLGRLVHEVPRGGWAAFMSDPAALSSYLGPDS